MPDTPKDKSQEQQEPDLLEETLRIMERMVKGPPMIRSR